jgi:hypothetical protein
MKNNNYIIDDFGNKCWLLNGVFHRIGAPAFEGKNGIKKWLVEGKLHREDGPAIEGLNGKNRYFLNDLEYSETEYNSITLSKKLEKELKSNDTLRKKLKM